MTDDLFSNTNNDNLEYNPEDNYVEKLVGEGKKYHGASETEAYNKLAYGKLEADRFIDRLKQENEKMRADLLAAQRLEELVTKLQTSSQTKQTPSNENNQQHERMDTVTPAQLQTEFKGLTAEQAEALVEEKLRSRSNLERSLSGLRKAYGENYSTVLDAEAKSLGLTKEFVNQLAKTNPDAFQRMFVKDRQQDSSVTPPTSTLNASVSPQGLTANGIKTQKFYQELKKKDPNAYWSPKVQQQEYEDAKKLGPAFFNG